MKVAYLGNFGVSFSTESHVALALTNNGHRVTRYQENEPGAFVRLAQQVRDFDFVLWTRTGWAPGVPEDEQLAMLGAARDAGVPTVGYHLDRWWGLNREGQVHDQPFFRVDLMCTADGGHDEEWRAAGVEHVWFPPGVSRAECVPGRYNRRMASDVAFVGNWLPGGYHAEWKHRPELVAFLRRTYRDRVRFWPRRGQPAVRGEALRDLYASVKVLVGDSCLVGNASRYWSDRIPESLGRGGFLVHPHVEGLDEHYTDGEHLRTWPLGDWSELRRLIDYYLAHGSERRTIAAAGKAHVLATATYEHRMTQLVALLSERGLIEGSAHALGHA